LASAGTETIYFTDYAKAVIFDLLFSLAYMPTVIMSQLPSSTELWASLQYDAEVAVVGGGCVGASTAYHLARLGCESVALFERDHLAWGATGKSSAIVNLGVWHASKPLTRMLLESIETFRNFNQAIGGKCGFNPTGWVGVAGPEQEDRVTRTVKAEREMGAETRFIHGSEIGEIEPAVFTDDLSVAVYEPRSGYADPVETTISFANNAERLGAQIHTTVEVTRLVVKDGRVTGMETEKGKVSARKVVVAANVWARRLFSEVGVAVPISSTRKQVCLFKLPNELGRPRVITDDFLNDLYVKPEGDQTLVGEIESPGMPADPDHFVETIDYDTVPRLAGKLIRRFPSMGAAVSRGGYAGPYDVSPDGHPILDEVPDVEGLYCAVGFSGHGFRFSPTTGRLMAEFVQNGKTEGIDIKEFRFSRFVEGKPITPLA
jgi:sarcosine oxidase subunit beta